MSKSTIILKNNLRREMIRRRGELRPEYIRKASENLIPRVLQFIENHLPQAAVRPITIMSYMSHLQEFPTVDLNQKFLDLGWRLALPYTNSNFEIEACVVDSLHQLKLSRMGIAEPDPSVCSQITAVDPDLILLPGIAFDRHGMRLGYGKGCYDRFLLESEDSLPLTAALAWSFQIVEAVPAEDHDRPCDCIFTENELICSAH